MAVKKPGGGFELRAVELGIGDEKFVEVKEGIQSGEAVILNPNDVVSEEEKRAKARPLPKPAPGARVEPNRLRRRKSSHERCSSEPRPV